jgi:putative endopeptidase
LINNTANYLTTALDKQNFDFTEKHFGTSSGRRLERGVNSVNGGLGEIVGKVYVKSISRQKRKNMTGMVKNLLKAYAESIKLDWMSENTKKTCQSR